MKLVYILMTSVLIVLFIIWNFVGSGEKHKSKNINRIFDILMVVAIIAVLFLGVKVFYSSDATEKELKEEMEQFYEGDFDEDIDKSQIVNYKDLEDSEETKKYWDNIDGDSTQESKETEITEVLEN